MLFPRKFLSRRRGTAQSPGGRRAFTRLDASSSEAADRVQRARSLMVSCAVCPRECGAARLEGEVGTCRTGAEVRVASWQVHHGEELPVSGVKGSGTIFISGCSLRCQYCQNHSVSQHNDGEIMDMESLAALMAELEEQGVHNINLVSPTHHGPQLLEAVLVARQRGLGLPIVWNTSGYERVELLQLLEGVVDIYLADMRYGDNRNGRELSRVRDYWTVNRRAIKEMHRQVGDLVVDGNAVATHGLIVRHLILPNGLSNSGAVFEFLADEVSRETVVSLMSQYYPAYLAADDPQIGRRLTRAEFEATVAAAAQAGLTKCICQEMP